ncbi:MAG: MmcQ/YjbR family DNA-binding protein [bacterium]|nr:MmcQ/YjbR family DNA-binding protein [bacterium]
MQRNDDTGILTAYCLSKCGAYEDFPFGPEPAVYKIGTKKIFALLSLEKGQPHLSLKCDPNLAVAWREKYPSVTPGYHMNKKHWNTVLIDESISLLEVQWMIDHSYELVYSSLTKQEKDYLSGNIEHKRD